MMNMCDSRPSRRLLAGVIAAVLVCAIEIGAAVYGVPLGRTAPPGRLQVVIVCGPPASEPWPLAPPVPPMPTGMDPIRGFPNWRGPVVPFPAPASPALRPTSLQAGVARPARARPWLASASLPRPVPMPTGGGCHPVFVPAGSMR